MREGGEKGESRGREGGRGEGESRGRRIGRRLDERVSHILETFCCKYVQVADLSTRTRNNKTLTELYQK